MRIGDRVSWKDGGQRWFGHLLEITSDPCGRPTYVVGHESRRGMGRPITLNGSQITVECP